MTNLFGETTLEGIVVELRLVRQQCPGDRRTRRRPACGSAGLSALQS
jgi:hypothetical protein